MRQIIQRGFALLAGAAVLAAVPGAAQTTVGNAAAGTFSKDVAPILQRSCESCHRKGGGAPMSLMTYEEVRPWARSIKLRTAQREMPPWFIERNVGVQHFKEDPSLTDEEIALIGRWVDAGAPQGNPADMPPPRQWAASGSWTIGEPDLVVSSPEVVVKAVGPDFHGTLKVVPVSMPEARYIKAVQTREVWIKTGERVGKASPGLNDFVVHHATVSPLAPGDVRSEQDEIEGRRFQYTYELGQNPLLFPTDTANVLPAKSNFEYEVHLHSVGKEVTMRIEVGFVFHPKGWKPKYPDLRMVSMGWGLDNTIDLPPGQTVAIDGYYVMPKSGRLMTFEPHMHISGTRLCMEVIYPNNVRETLNCAGYNHNWVKAYTYTEEAAPLLPKGTIVHIRGWYDNSASNRRNPEPRNWKGFGSRTIDDMFIALNRVLFFTDAEFEDQLAKRAEAKKKPQQTGTTAAARIDATR